MMGAILDKWMASTISEYVEVEFKDSIGSTQPFLVHAYKAKGEPAVNVGAIYATSYNDFVNGASLAHANVASLLSEEAKSELAAKAGVIVMEALVDRLRAEEDQEARTE